MKSKGFTLVEILAVIVILAILVGIAVPNMVGIGNKNRNNMYCTKVKNIENSAQQFAEDNFGTVEAAFNTSGKYEMTVQDLIKNGYYKKEDDSCNYTEQKPCVTDPRDKSRIDNVKIHIVIKNRRPFATYQGDKSSCEN